MKWLLIYTATLGAVVILARSHGDEAPSASTAASPGSSAGNAVAAASTGLAPAVPPARPAPATTAPALSLAESLAAFRVAPGFHVETVAAEPLVEAPVAIAFDPQGRLWVVEMRDYMPDAGTRSGAPDASRGRVVILEDTDGDGRMDKSTVFLDDLTLPRAIAFVHGGVLVAEPPNLWLCSVPGPDGKAKSKFAMATDYGTRGGQPEYQPNGLLRALDNWVYSAQGKVRYRFEVNDHPYVFDSTTSRGQWGIAQDDWGRLFFNYNSEHLRGDFILPEYLEGNPDLHNPQGANLRISRDQTVYPVRPNTGVNRGYQHDILRADGTLRESTAACGPTIYRGELFPPELRGSAFVCEPAANLVRCDLLTETREGWTAANPYGDKEFLASTDERFRPVNLSTGPEGALYVVDMHRGIIQHSGYMTGYLHKEIDARGLARPINLGRIYRIVPDGVKPGPLPRLDRLSPAALVAELSQPNGWRRDTAQRLIAESRDMSVVPALRDLAAHGSEPLGRLHALWTLEGLLKVDAATVHRALQDLHPRLRAAGLRLSESYLSYDKSLEASVLGLLGDKAPEVQLQLALTLGHMDKAQGEPGLMSLLADTADSEMLRTAALSGLRQRELEFLTALCVDPSWNNAPGRTRLCGELAQCVYNEGKPERVKKLFDLVAAQLDGKQSWRAMAVVDGLSALGVLKKGATITPVNLDARPDVLTRLTASGTVADPRMNKRIHQVEALLNWPGKSSAPGAELAGDLEADAEANRAASADAGLPAAPIPASSPTAQQARYDRGKVTFGQTCGACHQTDGRGLEGLAPPLAGSSWVSGPESRLVRIALHGVQGDIAVNGHTYQMEMPPMGALGDESVAEILTYIRLRWGGRNAGPVEASTVAAIHAQTSTHEGAWTTAALLKVP